MDYWAHPRRVWDCVFLDELDGCFVNGFGEWILSRSCAASSGALYEPLLVRALQLTLMHDFFQNFYMAGIAFNLIFIRVGAHKARSIAGRVEVEEVNMRQPSSASVCQDIPALHVPNITFNLVDEKEGTQGEAPPRCLF
jgi:hypothetical protein